MLIYFFRLQQEDNRHGKILRCRIQRSSERRLQLRILCLSLQLRPNGAQIRRTQLDDGSKNVLLIIKGNQNCDYTIMQ